MDTVWIVVADSARARIIRTQGRPGRTLEDLEAFSHSESRQQNQDLVSDRPGRNQASGRGDGRHAMGAPTDPVAHEREVFARQLAGRLKQAHLQGSFQHLVLVAEPGFLGELRAALDDGVANAVSHEVSAMRLQKTSSRSRITPRCAHTCRTSSSEIPVALQRSR